MELTNRIREGYTQYFAKYETSKNLLLTGILYSINLFSKNDIDNIKIQLPNYINKLNNDNDNDVFDLLMSFILNKLALKIIYYLPHMLDKPIHTGVMSVHVLFGENVTQLIAFCLVTESTNILNQLIKKRKNILHKLNIKTIENNELILNYNNSDVPKSIISDDYNKKNKTLIEKYNEYFDLFYKK